MAASITWKKITPSTVIMALSLVMTSWEGTSSTCSIMFILAPILSTIGTIRCKPGDSVRVYRPKRSTVYSNPCETALTPMMTMITAKTRTTITKIENSGIGIVSLLGKAVLLRRPSGIIRAHRTYHSFFTRCVDLLLKKTRVICFPTPDWAAAGFRTECPRQAGSRRCARRA